MEIFTLLISTILLRPYVFAYLGLYLLAGSLTLGIKRTLVFTIIAYTIAFASEYASTRIGIPYGLYHYTEITRSEEIYIFNVPLMDSLSYSFLAYFSYSLALMMVAPVKRAGWRFELRETPWYSKKVLILSSLLFMLQDVLIDPVSLRGSKWFLGQIYFYPNEGMYFGVPLSNFLGWLLVGFAIIYSFQKFDQWISHSGVGHSAKNVIPGPICYFINMIFILCVTFYIGEYFLGLISLLIFGLLFIPFILKVRPLI